MTRWMVLACALGAGVAASARAQEAAPAGQGGNPLARLLLLPDISAVGRAALAWNELDAGTLSPRQGPVAPAGKVQPVFQELELGLQAVVDPWLRADAFLAFGQEGASVEEAYVTTLGLPAGLQLRAGTLYAPFGRQNQQHAHAWDFADAPLSQARLVAVDGLKGPGLSASWLAPLPWFTELTVAYQETVPGLETAGRRTGLCRLLQYLDLGEAATLGVGLSAARLDERVAQEAGPGDGWRDLLGLDVYLKIRPPESRGSLALQGELFARRVHGAADPAADGRDLGGYAQAFLRLSPAWGLGLRWDRAPAASGPGAEQRWSGLASWNPSEFSRLRLQVSRDQLPGGPSGLEALLGLEFSIGAHGAHAF